MSQQETATDRLVGVIQSIQMAQESGVLTVRRGEGSTLEEGNIVFTDGQIKQTTTGRRSGAAALNWLSTWSHCRYTFTSTTSQGNRQTQPLNGTAAAVTLPGRAFAGDLRSGIAERQSEPLLPVTAATWERRPPPAPPPAPIIFYPTQPLDVAVRSIERNKLSRTHRQLFLLIDGQRSVQELTRLAGKNEQDVQALLRDLQRIGIIQSGGH